MNTTNEFKISETPSDDELKVLLHPIINPIFKAHISDWIFYAKPNEKKGLYILSKVIKHKGQKMFKTQLTKTKEEENDTSKLTLEEAYKRYQKRQTVSSYSEFYGGSQDDKYKYNNILKFKDFENLNYAEVINKDLYHYVQAWVSVEKSEQYKEFVLDFLRSYLSTVRSNRKFVTHNSDQFHNFKGHDKFTTHAPYLLNKTEKLVERVPTLEEMRARLNLDSYKLTENDGTKDNSNYDEVRNRKQQLNNGGRSIIKGIFNASTNTTYQEMFKGQHQKYPYSFKSDMYSSGIKGISPDAFVIGRINSNNDINDSLKNTVKTIMFSDNYNKFDKYI